MIKTIIKRSGDRVPFDAAKLNQWGQWSAEKLGRYVDWSMIVRDAVRACPEVTKSSDLQDQLIKACLLQNSWSYNRMAGRLYAATWRKAVFHGKEIPTIEDVQRRLAGAGLMRKLAYTSEEYADLEKVIKHDLDYQASYSELQFSRQKYCLSNRVTGAEYETPQFMYMRMAMALFEDFPDRMKHVKEMYKLLSEKKISAPTPAYVHLGTKLNGYSSCCLFKSGDTAQSLAAHDHIAYIMTSMGAGLGSMIDTRTLGDKVRGGAIKHMGKLPYFRTLDTATHANRQSGRGGSATTYFTCFDPEAKVICNLKNPLSTDAKRIRGLDYAFCYNRFFAIKAAKNEQIFTFTSFSAPDLFDAFYSGDPDKFEALYQKYESDPAFKKSYVSAREVLVTMLEQAYETGRIYQFNVDEANRHTPFKDPIYQSNLCTEVFEPTQAYESTKDLYSDDAATPGEVALCSLSAINLGNVTDDEYENVAYYALLLIDRCILMNDYVLTQVGVKAKARMSAGVSMIDLAHYMAKNHVSYSTPEGKAFIHRAAERHSYYVIKASLRLGKELGNCRWIYKTKWPDGWLPIDTYNRDVDKMTSEPLHYDWEGLRQEIIENGGIRHSVTQVMVPSESSSVACGATNGLYPIRDFTLIKTNADNTTYWAAPESERLHQWYDIAWDVPTKDLIEAYAIVQKFVDQGISADLYKKMLGTDTISTTEMLQTFFDTLPLKSRYYMNIKTTESISEEIEHGCQSGVCTL